ncbi:MAG TPA: PhzF family phenazine biosynthesis protein [Steroidobacteraceae bacterium]|jgi:trans-2,3-dihydro-3-hydroxyanthranilate isomerase
MTVSDSSQRSFSLRYVTVDVFTTRVFGGNPLAVVLDAQHLATSQMQAIATEFNYSETTFVVAPRDRAHTAQVRIFTARTEVPFAGHPNIGTAVVLARELESQGKPPLERFIFEEAAGLVPIRLVREGGQVVAAELTAPAPLSIGAMATVEEAAACLSLAPSDISTTTHPPQVVSVGLPFLVAELVSRDALRRAKPNPMAHERVLPSKGTDAIFAYTRGAAIGELMARMFAPLDATVEDPATGSATAATIALRASLSPERDAQMAWRIEQGLEMGRPSLILGRTEKRAGAVTSVHVAGHAVPVMRGELTLPRES